MDETKEKPVVELGGENGNSMVIIGRCTKALRKAGRSKEEIKEFTDDATSGDYDHVLQTAMKYCEVE